MHYNNIITQKARRKANGEHTRRLNCPEMDS